MSEASIKNLLVSSAAIRKNIGINQHNSTAQANTLAVPGKLHSSSLLHGGNNNDNANWGGRSASKRLGFGPSAGARVQGSPSTQRDHYKAIANNGVLLYQRNLKTDYFSLLLDGKCEVIAGKQGFRCKLSRWSYLCPDALEHVWTCILNNKSLYDYVAYFRCEVVENSRVLRTLASGIISRDHTTTIESTINTNINNKRDGRDRDSQGRMKIDYRDFDAIKLNFMFIHQLNNLRNGCDKKSLRKSFIRDGDCGERDRDGRDRIRIETETTVIV